MKKLFTIAVLSAAGLFDTSHMACINIHGEDAFSLLNLCFTRDLAQLSPGRCVYGAFLDSQGHCIDDAIVYKFEDTVFMVCVNAGMGGAIAAHLDGHKGGLKVDITDMTGRIAKMERGTDSDK